MPEKELWQIALDHSKTAAVTKTVAAESTLLVCGSKGAGKSTIIDSFLDKENPKPQSTIALEYSYGYKKGATKDIGHIYELGGGTWLTKLMTVPISANSLRKLSVMIVLDLSKPEELWDVLETLLKSLNFTLEDAIKQAEKTEPNVRQDLNDSCWKRYPDQHTDVIEMGKCLTPFPVPLTIIGGMYDKFSNFEPEQRKVISRTLRYVAHAYGAHLLFYCKNIPQLVKRSKIVMAEMLFETEAHFKTEVDVNKPLAVQIGQDSLAEIGPPPIDSHEAAAMRNVKNPLSLWKDAFARLFPQTGLNNPSQVQNPAADPRYAEATVDNLRKQKDQELEIYKRQCERKTKEEAERFVQDVYN